MNKFTYKQLQSIQESTTKKLIKYINKFIEEDRTLDSIEFYYPDFDKKKTMIAFNVWVSIDYKTKSDKSFIEHMLEEKPNELSEIEKDILIERNKSYISLFEILHVEEEYITVIDLLTRKEHKIWDPNVVNILKQSDLIFARIGKVLEHKSFIGNISFLPPSMKHDFIGEVFLDYNYARMKDSNLPMDKYLKEYSVNLYKIYTESVYEVMEKDDDSTSIIYGELEEFEGYLELKVEKSTVKKYITNLINVYEHLLMEDDLTFSHLDQVDFKELLEQSIEKELLHSSSQLSSYLSTLKLYLEFLKAKDEKYEKAYNSILEISKNRFLYIKNIKKVEPTFTIRKRLADRIANLFNEEAFDFLMDFERFLLYIMGNPLELTEKRRHIKRKHLQYINEIMENTETMTKKAPNQGDFIMLDLFYNFSLNQEILRIDKDMMTVTKKSSSFLKLSDEEKFSVFIEYIWADNIKEDKDNILDKLSGLEKNTFYSYENILDMDTKSNTDVLNLFKYSALMGLLKEISKPKLGMEINSFGKIIFLVLTNKDPITNDRGKLIQFSDYKKSK